MDVPHYNRKAWDHRVATGDPWTVPVDTEPIQRARSGDWSIVLTPSKPVPAAWFGTVDGADVLCLASGGGQQGPILAAAGARVTVFDNSPRQLEQDRLVAERESLEVHTVLGDMRDLGTFSDASFDLIVHPCSNCFVPDVRPVWREAFRVLRSPGHLLSGFSNPTRFLFEDELLKNGNLLARFSIPYSDLTSLTDDERQRFLVDEGEPLIFGHTLDDQIAGQIDVGFAITGFYEDRNPPESAEAIDRLIDTYIATRASK